MLQSPRGPTAYSDPVLMYQDQSIASPMLGPRRPAPDLMAGGGGGGNAGGFYNGNGGASGDPRLPPPTGGRMRGRGSAGGHLDPGGMVSPRTGAGDPYYGTGGGGGRGGYGGDMRYHRYGGGGGRGVSIGGADEMEMRGHGGGMEVRGDVSRGDVRDGVDVGLGYQGSGGGRRGGIGMTGGGAGDARMMRGGGGGHPRDMDGGVMHMDLRGGVSGHDRSRGDMVAGGMRDQRGMGMRGGADHRDMMRRADLRHGFGRDGMVGRGGGYMDPRGIRDRERGIGNGRPAGGLVGGGGGGVGPGGGRGTLLDEFRSSIGKNRKWELADLHGERRCLGRGLVCSLF